MHNPFMRPELSALLEEDEEGDDVRGTGSGDEEAESEGVAMELTGNTTMHTPGAAAATPAASQDDTPGLTSEWGMTPGSWEEWDCWQACAGTEWGWRQWIAAVRMHSKQALTMPLSTG
jgi:hypothetical protein